MKRVLALTLSAAMLLAMLCACGSPDAVATIHAIYTDPAESAAASLPTPPSHHPEETHHVEPEPSHHPEETHHTEPEPSHHPEETHHAEPSHHGTATPAPTPAPVPTPEPTPVPAAGVDLAAFYADVTSQYEFGFLQLAGAEMLDGYYSGLTGIDTEQCLVYICQMSMNNGEFGLVQVKNSGDVAAVKAVFQARIDYMVGDGNGPGGAWYPGPTEMWENNSRVVSNGNYVMMVIHENCDDIVSQFNALF